MKVMNTTSKILTGAVVMLTALTTPTFAQAIAGGQMTVNNSQIKKVGNDVQVTMNIDMSRLDLGANEGVVLIPMIVNGTDTVKLPAAEIYGRKRYIYYQRNNKTATPDPAVVERRYRGRAQTVAYNATTPYRDWMNNSTLVMGEGLCACDQTPLGDNNNETVHRVNLSGQWKLQYAYIQPNPETVKHRAESGSARLNFVVDKYDIRPDFGNNAAELRKIRQTIDLVKTDKDVELTGIRLHGYASPDGRYAHNAELAANRTNALRNYLRNYYSKLSESLFTAESTPEDWKGVRDYFAASDLKEKDALLKITDSNRTPDEKDRYFAQYYGDLYRSLLLKTVYPSLRRTDYTVTYNVRNFNLEEARRIIRERPQKLSLQEMYRVANSYPAGSDEFNEVFDVAVRMFPDDPLANLNAANVALSRGDKVSAARFLAKAGNSAEAQNARGVLALKNEDYQQARRLFRQAADAGLSQAKANLEEMDNHGR